MPFLAFYITTIISGMVVQCNEHSLWSQVTNVNGVNHMHHANLYHVVIPASYVQAQAVNVNRENEPA